MKFNILELPADVLLKVLINSFWFKPLTNFRLCNKKINEFIEEHRFEIAKKRFHHVDIKIIIDKDKFTIKTISDREVAEVVLEKCSALSFAEVNIIYNKTAPIEKKVLDRLSTFLKPLKLSVRYLVITSCYKNPSKDELEFIQSLNYGSVRLEFESGYDSSEIFSYPLIQKPLNYLILTLNCKSSPAELVFDCIKITKHQFTLDCREIPGDFAVDIVRCIIKGLSSGHYDYFPELQLRWFDLYPLNPLFSDMKLLWKQLPSRFGCNYIFAKDLDTKLLIIFESCIDNHNYDVDPDDKYYDDSDDYQQQTCHIRLIDKSQSALRSSLNFEYDRGFSEVNTDKLYQCLMYE